MDLSYPDWSRIASHLLNMLAAFALALPIAWNREKESRSAGIRTFPLVALASCALVLIGRAVLPDDPSAQARIIQGLITGIGFIGGGAILKHGGAVEGTATAASVWATGVEGIAVGYGRYEIAVILCGLTFATLWLLTPLKKSLERADERRKDHS